MDHLNDYIDTTNKFSQPADAIPVIDRSSHVSLGMEMARRAAQQQPERVSAPMPPIVPVAN